MGDHFSCGQCAVPLCEKTPAYVAALKDVECRDLTLDELIKIGKWAEKKLSKLVEKQMKTFTDSLLKEKIKKL